MPPNPEPPQPRRWPTPTPSDGFDPLRDLTDRQRHVIEAIVAPNPIAEASRITGVPRSTIYLWLKQSAPFVAALNWRRQVDCEHVGDIFRRADQAAATRLLDLLEDGDVDTVMAYIRSRGIGKMITTPVGPTDVDEIVTDETEARYRRREVEILDETALGRAATFEGDVGPRREAVREFVEEDLRHQAGRAAHVFEPEDEVDDFLDEV